VYISVARQFVPVLAVQYKPDIERQLSHALKAPIHIEKISGEIVRFNPKIMIGGLQIGNQNNIKNVSVELDVIDSILARQLRLSNLRIHGFNAALVQVENGWQLGDVFFAHNSDDDFSWIAMLSDIHLGESKVNITLKNKKSFAIDSLDLKLNQFRQYQRVTTNIVMPNKKPATIIAEGKGAWSNIDDMAWTVYAKVPDMNWLPWLQETADAYIVLKKLEGSGQIWLRWADGKINDVRVRLELPLVDWQYVKNHVNESIQAVHMDLVFQQHKDKTVLSVPTLSFMWQEHAQQLGGWAFSKTALDDGRSVVLIEGQQLKIDSFVQMSLASKLLPDDGQEVLAGLNPRGRFDTLQAVAYFNGENSLIDFKTIGKIVDVALDAWDGSPQASGIAGIIEFNKEGGHFALNSKDYSMEFPDLFAQGWNFSNATGDLYWLYDDEKLVIRSGLLEVTNNNATVFGQFDYTSPHDVKTADHLGLQLGFRNVDASHRMQYIPVKEIDKSLVTWLENAIIKGTIVEGTYLYDGAVVSDTLIDPTQIVALDLKDVTLKFDEHWPVLEGINGSMVYNNDGLKVRSNAAKMLNADIQNINVTLPYDSDDLHIQGQADAPVQTVLDLLRTTPLHKEIGSALDHWQVNGLASAEIDLVVPLNAKPAQADVRGTLKSAQLKMPDVNLTFDNINGDLSYSTSKGLNSQKLTAKTLDMPIALTIVTPPKDKTLTARLRTQGSIAIDTLAKWQPSKLWSYAKGTLPYSLELQVPMRTSTKPTTLIINSPLQGTAVSLPKPFGKSAGESAQLTVATGFNQNNYRVDIDLNKQEVRGILLLGKNNEPVQASIALGKNTLVREPKAPGLWVTGDTPSVVVDDWVSFIKTEKKISKDIDPVALGINVDINAQKLTAFDYTLENAGLTVSRGKNIPAWRIGVDSALVAGDITLPDDAQQPYDVNLKYIKLPQPKTDPNAVRTDPLASIAPTLLPAMQVKIENFSIGADDYGKWYFTTHPIKNGVEMRDIQIDNMKYFTIVGKQALWTKDKTGTQSYFKGSLTTTDLGTALTAWGYNSGTESKTTNINVDFSWPGSPAFFSAADGNGNIKIELEDGMFTDEGGKVSMLKIFGALNLSALTRRLTADFSDLYKSGISFDKAQANLDIKDGIATFAKPATITGPSSDFKITGSTNLRTGIVDQEITITPPVGQNAAVIATVLCGPACGGVTYLVQKALGSGIRNLVSIKYKMTGSYENPTTTKETITTTPTPVSGN
jgi:uncharacterized protein (TIGR02099 family)